MDKKFRLQPRTALLQFEGHYEGAEIRVRLNVPLETWFRVQAFLEEAKTDAEKAIGLLAELLVSWNLQDEQGNDLPANREGIGQMYPDLLLLTLVQWYQAASEPSGPLASASVNGSTLVEASTPMDGV